MRPLGYIESDIVQGLADREIAKIKATHKRRTERERLAHEAKMKALGLDYKDKELASRMEISERQDRLFKDLALYVGLSVGTIAILVALAVGFIKKKGGRSA